MISNLIVEPKGPTYACYEAKNCKSPARYARRPLYKSGQDRFAL